MALYDFEYIVRVVVEADDMEHAHEVAKQNRSNALSEITPEIECNGKIRREEGLPSGWDVMCLPYGGDGSTRIKDILSEP